MLSRRTRRRLVRHHLPLLAASAAGFAVVYAVTSNPNPVHGWSMATGYVGLALLGITLVIGPWNVLRRRPNPTSTDLRRDIGIWAGVFSIVHFVVGWQEHMKHRYEYFLHDVTRPSGTTVLVPRMDLFGFANDTGLIAVLLSALLLWLSNDVSLRRLGTARWKQLQRWNYAAFVLVAAHGIAFQVIEERKAPFVVAMAAMLAATIAAQLAGYFRVRRLSSGREERQLAA